MESEVNIVKISLNEYLQLYDKSKLYDKNIQRIIDIVLYCTDLNKEKTELEIDSYDFRCDKILSIIKEVYPKEYEKQLQILKEREK